MNTKANDRQYRQIMKSIKARQEMMKMAISDQERQKDMQAINELLGLARTLTKRI